MYIVSRMHEIKDMQFARVLESSDINYTLNFAFEMSSQEPEYIYKVQASNGFVTLIRSGRIY